MLAAAPAVLAHCTGRGSGPAAVASASRIQADQLERLTDTDALMRVCLQLVSL